MATDSENTVLDTEISKLYLKVLEDPKLDLEHKKVLLDEIRKLRPASENRWNFRWVIWALALVAIISPVASAIALIFSKEPNISEGVLALSSTAVGALAAYVTSGLKK
ncbi:MULTISPECIES: hypothetical protein [Pseudoalteromonas]|uniref:Uncharacterized protein n=1 Tax=Pseudoalteromonas obscura TaxID=3048491 RepID=A0ABT7EP65_9GAMM|nr:MULTISPECIES: hypothetical protein [Pseudoalteromonas]MBQ4834854.1 hypothetical protein [Pseudoalteromonas luteoviolacea]MDK2596846.1 hypothetical protein [Pseudoalteromonas sp. P94(2023)]